MQNKMQTNRSFKIANPDYELSPYTGMTRAHWMQSAKFLLKGVFGHINNMDQPIVMPKQDKITYPQPDDPSHRFQAAEFEGLARTMMLASPILLHEPDLVCNNIRVRDYYANQLLLASDKNSPRYLGKNSEFSAEFGVQQYQHTVEGAALVIALMMAREQIWEQYNEKEKAQIADLISDYAHTRTIGNNWRFFNVLMLTFLKINGYNIDECALKDHLQHLLSNYAGDGWYVDDITYDYYNPWGFHFYGPIWCKWYGYEHEPEMAAIFEKRNLEFIGNYPRFFSREGNQLMWGRSIIYRFAASAAFGAHFLMKDPVLDPGHARRVASGNIMQFLGREDIYVNNLPCLGFYGPFLPLVQFYSCATSPFWLAKTYIALTLPEDSPFWISKENEGFWSNLGRKSQHIDLPGPGIQVVNHGSTGTSEIRTAKVPKHDPYYNQLQFNTNFYLEAVTSEGGNPNNYSIREYNRNEEFRIPKDIAFNKMEDGIFYRQMNTQSTNLGDPNKGGINKGPERIDLADIIVPGGVIRVDRVRVPYANELHLGHFALPHVENAAIIKSFTVEGYEGITASIPGRKIALVAVNGWEKIQSVQHKGMNPEADESTVIYVERTRKKDYCGMEVMITIMLHRLDNNEWTNDELMPIKSWEIIPWAPSGNSCGVRMKLKDGRELLIDYGNVDGRRII